MGRGQAHRAPAAASGRGHPPFASVRELVPSGHLARPTVLGVSECATRLSPLPSETGVPFSRPLVNSTASFEAPFRKGSLFGGPARG